MCSNRCLTLLLCAVALGLSAYAFYEELRMQEDPEYKPLCDIDERVSCSKAFNSTWGRGFGLAQYIVASDHWLNQPNPVYAFFVYPFMALLGMLNIRFIARLQTYFALLLNVGSVYLGYILYFVIDGLCVVCISLYVVNFLILVTSYLKLRALNQQQGRKQQQEKAKQHLRLPTTSNPMDFKKNL